MITQWYSIVHDTARDIKRKMSLLYEVFGHETWDENDNLTLLIRQRPYRQKEKWYTGKRLIYDKKYVWWINWWDISAMRQEIQDRMWTVYLHHVLEKYDHSIALKKIFWLDNIFIKEWRRWKHLGSALYEDFEKTVKNKWYSYIILDTKKKSDLLSFYASLWFKNIWNFVLHTQTFEICIKKI